MIDFLKKVLDHVVCSHAALDKAQSVLEKRAAQDKMVKDLIPQVVEALVKHERISPEQRKEAAQMLENPVNALKILIKAADVSNTMRPPSLGRPNHEKRSYAQPEEKESDLVFRRRLLGDL